MVYIMDMMANVSHQHYYKKSDTEQWLQIVTKQVVLTIIPLISQLVERAINVQALDKYFFLNY